MQEKRCVPENELPNSLDEMEIEYSNNSRGVPGHLRTINAGKNQKYKH